MRKEGIATPAPSTPAVDEVSANGDKPSAGNEHFCGKLASSAFLSIFLARARQREKERERERAIWKRGKNVARGMRDFDEAAENSRPRVEFSARARPMILFHRPGLPPPPPLPAVRFAGA